jgi:hypothetical protein
MLTAKRFFLSLFVIILLSLTSFARDDSAVRKETDKIKQLTKGADLILTGKVHKKVSGWNDSKTRIYTKTTLQVEEVLKGQKSDASVEVTSPGGEVDGIGELYTHMPRFADDEEVLVFLKKNEKDGNYRVINGEEGKISIPVDPETEKKSTGTKIQLDDLKAQIKRYAKDK